MRYFLFLFVLTTTGLSAQTALRTERLVANGTLPDYAAPRLLLPLRAVGAIDAPAARPAPNRPASPAAWRYQDLAFFCRVEVQLEQRTRMNVRFRLGSTDYVDYLEGK